VYRRVYLATCFVCRGDLLRSRCVGVCVNVLMVASIFVIV
jgi:hypothetical protein